MGKINFSKVEKTLDEQLKRMQAGLYPKSRENSLKTEAIPPPEVAVPLLQGMERLLKRIQAEDPQGYAGLHFSLKKVKKMLLSPASITSSEWTAFEHARKLIETYKKNQTKPISFLSEDEKIEKERQAQDKARFNVKKNWLPLK